MPYVSGRIVHDADAHIMETPTWLRDHADPGVRDRIEPLRYTGGNELRQTGDPDEQLRDLDAAFDRLAEQAPLATSTAPIEASRDHAAQELRGHRLVPRRGSPARARPARLLEPARVQHVPQPPAARLGAQRRPRARLRRRPGPQPRHGRVLLGRPAAAADAATCRSPTSTGRRRWPTRPSTWARPRCSSRRAARRATRPATSASTRCGRRPQEAGIPVVFHVGGTGDLIDPATSATACPIPPDFHGGEENFRSVDYMGIPAPAGADAGHA